jgi:TonB family protein
MRPRGGIPAAGLLLALAIGVRGVSAAPRHATPPRGPGDPGSASRAPAFSASLDVDELGFDGRFRIRLYVDSGFYPVPENTGTLVLVAADSASGDEAFFIPTDLAFELGAEDVYRVEFEQASDLFGQALGGKLRPGDRQIGFLLIPKGTGLSRFLPAHPESVTVRYANRRVPLRPALPKERSAWEEAVPKKILAGGLNLWWTWIEAVNKAPAMTEGDRRFLAERVFPGEGHVLDEEGMSAEGLRNAILRVGDRRLLESPSVERVAPRYPAAVRQFGIGGLVVALCYITGDGSVGDAVVLASDTVHLLNLSTLSAAMQWRFAKATDADGKPVDGWRLIPFQFQIAPSDTAGGAATSAGLAPPRVVKPVIPEFPVEALNRRIEGTVIYRVKVDERGKLVEAILERGADPVFNRAALEAIEHTRFLPATRNGVPVPGELLMPFPFKLPK